MKDSTLKERLGLIEREVATLADKLKDVDEAKKALEDIQKELKGLKLFLSRVHPEFKSQFPDIIKKVKG